MEGYITDAENLKKTFIKSLSTYLKVSISDLAPRKGTADEKPAPQAAQPAPTLILKKPRSAPDGGSEAPSRAIPAPDSAPPSAVTAQTSIASTSASVKSSIPSQMIQTGSSAFSSVAVDRKTAKYCRETFKELLVQVSLPSPSPSLLSLISSRQPRITCWIGEIVLYPPSYIPSSIASTHSIYSTPGICGRSGPRSVSSRSAHLLDLIPSLSPRITTFSNCRMPVLAIIHSFHTHSRIYADSRCPLLSPYPPLCASRQALSLIVPITLSSSASSSYCSSHLSLPSYPHHLFPSLSSHSPSL
jgi:hypothetical protein